MSTANQLFKGTQLLWCRIIFLALTFLSTPCLGQDEYEHEETLAITGNRTPCVNKVETYTAGGAHGCLTVEIHVVGGTKDVDYQVVGTTSNSITVRWLKGVPFFQLEGAFRGECLYGGSNGSIDYLDHTEGTVYDIPGPLPAATLPDVTITEAEFLHLSVPGYTKDLTWHEGTDPRSIGGIGNAALDLSPQTAGTYVYTGQVMNPGGCPLTGIQEVVVKVHRTPVAKELNWIETRGYDDVGLINNSLAYFGPSGEPVQAQTKSLETNEIFTTETIRDRQGRTVLTTLAAPTGINTFVYRDRFFLASGGMPFDYDDLFLSKVATSRYSVGWYYSPNNNKEKHVPATEYPYSRNDYFYDGSNEVRFSTGPGEAHQFQRGAGHETLTGRFPVVHELDDYVAKRNASVVPGGTMTVRQLQGTVLVTRDANHHYTISVVDGAGRTLMSANQGMSTDYDLAVNNTLISNISNPSSPYYNRSTYFYLLNTSQVTFNADQSYASIYYNDLLATSAENNYAKPGVPMQMKDGFYRVKVIVSGYEVSIVHTHYLKDITYFFYDDVGRLISSVSPNGFKQWKAGTAYSQLDKKWQVYDFKGQLTSTHDPDGGTVKYLYRKDGTIRFSQNDKQAGDRHFSYTHYDRLARPVESGVCIDTTYRFGTGLSAQLEYAKQVYFPREKTRDWLTTRYDVSDDDEATGMYAVTHLLREDYPQRFVRGAVSGTENAYIQTWYSYDELGRVTWMVQKPKALKRVFVVTYAYDYLGNVLHTGSLAYDVTTGARVKEFYHHYEYDKDKRLSKAYTSETEAGARKLRATYEYYVHGPLKRIVLGSKAQGIDFVYNIQGWLKQINHPDPLQDPGKDGNDAFGMVLDYYDSDMSNLFVASVAADPYRSHTLFDRQSAVASNNHAPLIRFAPDYPSSVQPGGPSMRDFSADNPRYKKMLHSLITPSN
jgi:hypothetical protein